MNNLRDLTLGELESFLTGMGQPAYRARQIYRWVFAAKARHLDEMTDLPQDLRRELSQTFRIDTPRIADLSPRAPDGTRKYLFEFQRGDRVEAVYLPGASSATVCISTQVGCSLNCEFCATGRMGFSRNLSTGEMVSQVLEIEKEEDAKIRNVVLMGMGEPFYNFDAVMKALTLFTDSKGLGWSARRLTVSTIGIVPAIEKITREGMNAKLAISLHATNDQQRSRIIPVNKTYPLGSLMKALRAYAHVTRYPITFEYILIKDLNDRPEDAEALSLFLQNIPAKINILGLHPTGSTWLPSPQERVVAFQQKLRATGLNVTLRTSRGLECNAACGQLATPIPSSVRTGSTNLTDDIKEKRTR